MVIAVDTQSVTVEARSPSGVVRDTFKYEGEITQEGFLMEAECGKGEYSLLFPNKQAMEQYVEKQYLVRWLLENIPHIPDLKLEQLKEVKRIMEEHDGGIEIMFQQPLSDGVGI